MIDRTMSDNETVQPPRSSFPTVHHSDQDNSKRPSGFVLFFCWAGKQWILAQINQCSLDSGQNIPVSELRSPKVILSPYLIMRHVRLMWTPRAISHWKDTRS